VPSQRGVNTAVQQRQQHEMACFWGVGKGKILSEGAGRPADRQPTKAVKEGADQSPLAGRPNCFLLYKNRVNSSGNINSKSNSITKGSRWWHRDAQDS